jgi:hypothetical protein
MCPIFGSCYAILPRTLTHDHENEHNDSKQRPYGKFKICIICIMRTSSNCRFALLIGLSNHATSRCYYKGGFVPPKRAGVCSTSEGGRFW